MFTIKVPKTSVNHAQCNNGGHTIRPRLAAAIWDITLISHGFAQVII